MGVRSEGDEEVVIDETQADEAHDDEAEEGQDEGAEADEGGESGDGEVVVQIGEEEAPTSEEQQPAPEWVKDLRKRQRELAKENADLKARLSAGNTPAKGKPELPPKPKLADFDYDEEKYDQARDEWDRKKRAVDAWEADQEAQAKQAQEAVRKVHENYATSKKALKVSDFQDAEDEVLSVFSEVQQNIVLQGAKNPAAMVYALGRTPAKLKELASKKDPLEFAWAAAQLEKEIKVSKRTSTKPAPDTPLRGTSAAQGSSKAQLERLEAEAARTGDRTKVVAYKRQMKQAGK